MGITEAFATYKAKLVNVQWAVSSLTESELIVSLWKHRMKPQSDGTWIYQDYLGRWSGHGNALFGAHLRVAIAEGRPVRLVMATADTVALIEGGGDGSKANNTFKARPERIGRVTEFDGNNFTIVFARPTVAS